MKKLIRPALPAVSAVFIWLTFRIFSGELLQFVDYAAQNGGLRAGELLSLLFPHDLMALGVILLAAVAAARAPEPRLGPWEWGFSALAALLWLLGYGFNATDGWGILFGRPQSALLAALAFLGLLALVSTALRWARAWAGRLAASGKRLPAFYERHTFLVSWGAIFLCWLPFILIRYPGGVEYDAHYQIEQALGFLPMTAHWPPFSSALMGGFVKLGKAALGSYDAGLFAFVVFQSLVSSAILAYTLKTMKDLGTAPLWRAVSLALYALAVVYPNYLTSVVKDALFAAVTVLLVTLLARCLLLERRGWIYAALGGTGLLLCLLRKNGVYVLAPCALLLALHALVKRSGRRLPVVLALAGACLLSFGYERLLLPALDIPPGSVAEALSVPFQQTARYVRDYPGDVTEEEKAAIGAVLDYPALEGGIYDPDLSDPVKGAYHGDSGALIRYFGVWGAQFFRHPGVYFQATLANSCGFYYPNARISVFYDDRAVHENLNFSDPEALRPAKDLLRGYVEAMDMLPVLMLVGSAGFNTWVLLYLVIRALKSREKKLLLLLLPSLMGVLICVAGPTFTWNGVRYALPYIYATPILAGICLFTKPEGSRPIEEK